MLHYLPPEADAESAEHPPTLASLAAVDDSQSQIYLHPSPIQLEATGSGTAVNWMDGDGEAQPSPTLNLSRVYTTVVHTDSYKEMWNITRSIDDQIMLAQVLRPDRDCVHDALNSNTSNSNSNSITLISSYFDYSEETTCVCLNLHKSVDDARKLYWPLHTLIRDFPMISPSHSYSYYDLVYQELLKFDLEENPFPFPDSHSHTFDRIRDVFSDLKRQLERRLRKSNSRIRLVRHATADSAVCCAAVYIPVFAKREVAQLKVASKNSFVLKTDLDTLDTLVRRLHNAVEDDKRLIRIGLKIGNDHHTIQEVLKQLEKNHHNLVHYLLLLEEKICTCFTTVNRSRSQLLSEILGPHQS